MYCSNCGKKIDINNLYCPNCGTKNISSNPENNTNNEQLDEDYYKLYSEEKKSKKSLQIILAIIVLVVCSVIGIAVANYFINYNNSDDYDNYYFNQRPGKEILSEYLLAHGYVDFALVNADAVRGRMYYKEDQMYIAGNYCYGQRIIQFNKNFYDVHFVCNEGSPSNHLDMSITYYWEKNTMEADINGNKINIDEYGNAYCYFTGCESWLESMTNTKSEFLDLLSYAGVTVNDISY